MVAVSIVVYHSPVEHLRWACRSLAGQTLRPDLLTVHINSTSPGMAADVAALLAESGLSSDLTQTDENIGFSGAHNAALGRAFSAGHDAVLVYNPDLALAPDALAQLMDVAADYPGALLGPVLELADPDTLEATGLVDTVGIRWTSGGRHLDDRQGELLPQFEPSPRRVDGISGACLLVTRRAYDDIVGASGEFLDEDFVAYREDAELAYRAALLGIQSYLVPTARGLHIRRLRGTARGVDAQIDLLGVRNRFLIASKYGRQRPGGAVGPWVRDAVVISSVLLRERQSLPGLRQAWQLRRDMRRKGARIRAAVAARR